MYKFFTFLLLIVWFGVSIWWYDCKIKEVCTCDKETETALHEAGPVKASLPYSVYFKKNETDALKGDRFAMWRDSIMDCLHKNHIVEITGYVGNNETFNGISAEAEGMMRAKSAIQLLGLDSAALKFILYKGAGTAGMQPSDSILGLLTFDCKPIEDNIVEVNKNKVIIYFKKNTNSALEADKVKKALREFAGANKDADIMVTGHADISGNPDLNFRLAGSRATAIKNMLIKYGLSETRITAESRGQDEPQASNETEEGRAKNRRVEIFVK